MRQDHVAAHHRRAARPGLGDRHVEPGGGADRVPAPGARLHRNGRAAPGPAHGRAGCRRPDATCRHRAGAGRPRGRCGLLRRAGGLAGPRGRGPRRARRGHHRPGGTRAPARPPHAGAVRWPVGARGAGRPAALPVRRLPSRRADERPRPRRPRVAGAVPGRGARTGRPRQPRPGVPRAADHPGAGLRPRAGGRRRLPRRLRRLRRRAPPRAGAGPRRTSTPWPPPART